MSSAARHKWALPKVSWSAPPSPQGDTAGNEFFVLESGAADALLQRPGDAAPRRVAAYGPGGSFGELALLYSAPRAATVRSTGGCWGIKVHGHACLGGLLASWRLSI